MELSRQEELAIELLKKAARHWPESLWVFAADGMLHVMKKSKSGLKVFTGVGVNSNFEVASINIEADGGDW